MEIPRHWRLKKQRYALVGEVCPHCEAKIFPPRDVCPECNREAKTAYTFSGRGEVYSHTTIYNPPAGFQDSAPYTVALIKLDEGPLLLSNIVECKNEDIFIGMPVEVVFHDVTEEIALPKFKPGM